MNSGESFTDTSTDEINITQVHNQYRERLNIPFPEEIERARNQYGIPASKMSLILGFGLNFYRLWEAGEIPLLSNSKLIQLAANPAIFKTMVERCDALNETTKAKYIARVNNQITKQRSRLLPEIFEAIF